MSHKKNIFLLCLALSLLLAFAAQAAGLSREKAFQIIYATIKERSGIPEEDLVVEKEERDKWGDGWWFVSLRQKEHQGTTGLIEIQINPEGGVGGYAGPLPLWQAALQEQVEKTARQLRVNRAGFSIADMAALSQEMAPYMDSLKQLQTEQEAKGRKLSGIQQAMFAFLQPMSLPGPDAMPEAPALEAAKSAILKTQDWTPERLALFPLYMAMHYQSQAQGKAIYQFIFSQEGTQPTDGASETAWEAYEKGYRKDLAALYGGDAWSAPRFVSVKLDAATGQLVEPPYTSYFGPDYDSELGTIR